MFEQYCKGVPLSCLVSLIFVVLAQVLHYRGLIFVDWAHTTKF